MLTFLCVNSYEESGVLSFGDDGCPRNEKEPRMQDISLFDDEASLADRVRA